MQTDVRHHQQKRAAIWTVSMLISAVLISSLSGCGYRFSAAADNRIASAQSLWVAFIANDTISSTAQTVLRRALLDECLVMRGSLPAGSATDADLLMNGGLRSYSITAISYSAIDRVREFRLTIAVDLEIRRRGETSPFWKGALQSYQDYPANDDLALQHNSEEAALEAASRKLARKFVTTLEQSY